MPATYPIGDHSDMIVSEVVQKWHDTDPTVEVQVAEGPNVPLHPPEPGQQNVAVKENHPDSPPNGEVAPGGTVGVILVGSLL